jgi:hypothetical protein
MVLSWSIVRSLTCIAMGEVLQGVGSTIVAYFDGGRSDLNARGEMDYSMEE